MKEASIGRFVRYFHSLKKITPGSANVSARGCVNPASWLPLAASTSSRNLLERNMHFRELPAARCFATTKKGGMRFDASDDRIDPSRSRCRVGSGRKRPARLGGIVAMHVAKSDILPPAAGPTIQIQQPTQLAYHSGSKVTPS